MCDRIGRPERSSGSSGAGAAVEMRKVSGSTISSLVTCRVIRVKGEGLFGTLAARSKVKTTSSAVKGEPSWNVTPGRSLNSHTVSPTGFHDSASAGTAAGGRPWRPADRTDAGRSGCWGRDCGTVDRASSARSSARSAAPAPPPAARRQQGAAEEEYALFVPRDFRRLDYVGNATGRPVRRSGSGRREIRPQSAWPEAGQRLRVAPQFQHEWRGAVAMNGAESLVRTLVKGGVEVCFANPGTSEMHFVAALDRVEGMRCVLGLFEGVCSGAADGYYRMTDKPGLDPAASGPGPRQRRGQPAQRQEGQLRHRQHRRRARDLSHQVRRAADRRHRGHRPAVLALGQDLADVEDRGRATARSPSRPRAWRRARSPP